MRLVPLHQTFINANIVISMRSLISPSNPFAAAGLTKKPHKVTEEGPTLERSSKERVRRVLMSPLQSGQMGGQIQGPHDSSNSSVYCISPST